MTRRDATRARGGVLLALVVVALVAAAGAGRASAAEAVAPWQAFDALDGALFDAELAATTNDADALAVAGRRAAVAAGELADGFDPSARASAARLRRAADGVVSERNGVDLAVTAATARATALSGAYETILAATRAGDLDTARAWLLVREFKPVTRFSHPSAASSVAIASLADGVIPRARAVRSIRSDLLDTYEALLRTSLSDTEDALRAGFPEKAAGSAATARGYWWILREAFVGQRGEAAAVRLDSAFDGLVGAARSGRPAATAGAAAAVVDDLLSFRAAPLGGRSRCAAPVSSCGSSSSSRSSTDVVSTDGTVVVHDSRSRRRSRSATARRRLRRPRVDPPGRDLAATRPAPRRARHPRRRLADASAAADVADPGASAPPRTKRLGVTARSTRPLEGGRRRRTSTSSPRRSASRAGAAAEGDLGRAESGAPRGLRHLRARPGAAPPGSCPVPVPEDREPLLVRRRRRRRAGAARQARRPRRGARGDPRGARRSRSARPRSASARAGLP